MKVVPINIPKINWPALDDAMGHRVSMDTSKLKGAHESPASLLVLGDSRNYLRLITVGFLVEAERSVILSLSLNTPLDIVHVAPECYILQSNMVHWRWFCLQDESNRELRWIMNQIHTFFCMQDFKSLWTKFQKKDLGDGTYKLVRSTL